MPFQSVKLISFTHVFTKTKLYIVHTSSKLAYVLKPLNYCKSILNLKVLKRNTYGFLTIEMNREIDAATCGRHNAPTDRANATIRTSYLFGTLV